MDSKRDGSVTVKDSKSDLDSLFSDLLQQKKPMKSDAGSEDPNTMFAKFLDKEIGEKDLKLAEALKEVGMEEEATGPVAVKAPVLPQAPAPPVAPKPEPPKVESVKAAAPVAPPAAKPPQPPVKPATEAKPMFSTVQKGPAKPASVSKAGRPATGAAAKSAGIPKNYIIIGAAALVLVGVGIYFMVGGSSQPPAAPPAATQAPAPQPQVLPQNEVAVTLSGKAVPVTPNVPAPSASQANEVEKGKAPETPARAANTSAPASTPAAPASSTWSPTESVSGSQNLPMPSQAALRGPDLPMPAAPAPPPSQPASAAPAAASSQDIVLPAQAASRVLPQVPEIARKMNITGIVRVLVKIDAAGKVTQATALSGPAILRPSAETAVRQWKFKPARTNGQNIASEATLSIEYKN
jgi:protein TonB